MSSYRGDHVLSFLFHYFIFIHHHNGVQCSDVSLSLFLLVRLGKSTFVVAMIMEFVVFIANGNKKTYEQEEDEQSAFANRK